jgi:hypothetical protein
MKYGLVFKINDIIFLAEYDEDGNIGEGCDISDEEGVYQHFTGNDVSFVELYSYQQDVMKIRDLKMISIRNDEDPNATFSDFLKEGGGPEFAKSIYDEVINGESSRNNV